MSLHVQNSLPKLNCNTLWTQSGFSSMDISPSASSTRSSIASYGFLGGSPSKESTKRMDFGNNSHSSSMSLEDPMKEAADNSDFRKVALDKQFAKEQLPEVENEEEEAGEGAAKEVASTTSLHYSIDTIHLDPEEDIPPEKDAEHSVKAEDILGETIVAQERQEEDETASLHYSSDAVDAGGPEEMQQQQQQPQKVQEETHSEIANDVMKGSSSSEEEHTTVLHRGAFSRNEQQKIFNIISPTKTSQLDPEQLHIRKSFSDGIIDNTSLEYVPIRLKCGVNVMCAPRVLSKSPLVLRCLQTDAQRLFELLPRSVHDLLRRTKIWVNASYSYGSFDDPQILRHSTAHHSEEWLVQIAKDVPSKACGIEIYDCQYYERMRLHWNGAGLLLHEFCHLVHQFCLGLDCPKVVKLYQQADASGKYHQTPRRDWAGCEQTHDLAYAMVDPKEFFAEMSVTYLSTGYRRLDRGDANLLETCSPPLLLPDAFNRVLRQHQIKDPLERPEDSICYILNYAQRRHPRPKLEICNPIFRERAIATNCRNIPICNKFYPFTRGQLRYHDPSLCDSMGALWREIARWRDPNAESHGKCSFPFL